MTPPAEPGFPVRRPPGDGLLRARFAGAMLVGASASPLAVTALSALQLYPLAVLLAALGTLAWLPALHGLEHFLKRRTEATSLLALAAGTAGVVAVIADAARASAAGAVSAPPPWPWPLILGARLLLPASLVVFGAALAFHRLLPAWSAAALAAGSLVQLLNWTGVLALPPLLDQTLVCAGASWLGARLLHDPEGWRRGVPEHRTT